MTLLTRHSLGLIAILACCVGNPLWVVAQSTNEIAQTHDEMVLLSERLKAAEKRIISLEQFGNDANTRLDSSLDSEAPLFGEAFDEKLKARIEELTKDKADEPMMLTRPTAQLFGRLHLEALNFGDESPGIGYFENPDTGVDPEHRIQFRRIRIGAQGKILDDGVYRVELDFGDPSRSTFRDVYAGFENLPVLQTLLIGSQKRPLGMDGWNSNQHVLFLERPLAVNAFNPNFRRIGVQSYGHSQDDSLNWQFGVFELKDLKSSGRDIADRTQLSYNTRMSGTPWYDEISGGRGYLHVGLSNMFATTDADAERFNNDTNQARFGTRPELQTSSEWIDTGTIIGATNFNVTGLESALNIGSLQIAGEYLRTGVQRRADSDLEFQGGYVQAAYFLTGEYMPWDRQSGRLERPKPLENFFMVKSDRGIGHGLGAFQVAARWSALSLSEEDIRGGNQENVTLGLNWYWTPFSKLVCNVVNGRIRDRDPVGGFTDGRFTGMGVRMLMDF